MAKRWVPSIGVASAFVLIGAIASCGADGDDGATSRLTHGADEVSCARGVTLCRNGEVASCVDLRKNDANCGDCNRACAASMSCRDGECLPAEEPSSTSEPISEPKSCGVGLTVCASVCVDLLRDALNCGACDSICGSNGRCRDGSCVTDET